MKALSIIFGAAAALLSHIMCAVVAYNYCELQWGGKYAGYSAPPSTAFALALPFILGVGVCAALALYFHHRAA